MKLLRRWNFDPLGLVGMLLLIGLWFALVPLVPRSALPTPWGVAGAIVNKFFYNKTFQFYGLVDTGYFPALVYTIQNVLMATVGGGIVGILAGLVTARSKLVRAVFDPIVLTLGTVPILIASPFLLLWLGADRLSSVAMVGFYAAVTLYTYAQRAALNLNPVYESAARTYGASRGAMLRDLLIPGTLPEILGGIRIALAGAWGLEAIAELLGAQRGIGKLIESITGASDVESLFGALILLGITAMIFDVIISFSFARLTRWRGSRGSGANPRIE